MKLIPLTQGQFAIVDSDDFDTLSQYKWMARKDRYGFYAAKGLYKGKINGKYKVNFTHMHRFILRVDDPNLIVDHINGNTLDNRKENLRIANKKENSRNLTRIKSNNTSGYRGVMERKDCVGPNKWRARINVDGVKKTIGHYSTAQEAARAFDRAARTYFGEFSGKLNFPDEE